MIGVIGGDIIGSHYERNKTKNKDFNLFSNNHFTDDTVMTMAIANAILTNTSYKENIIYFGRKYFEVGYGSSFRSWLQGSSNIEIKHSTSWDDNSLLVDISDENSFQPYNSWGNGSAMRVAPIAYAFNTLDKVMEEAKKSAEVTHNHPEGIKGAQAIAMAMFLARNNHSKEYIKDSIERVFQYDLSRTYEEIKPNYKFEVSCQKSVPESIICFLESKDYEDCIRLAISLGGDADTMAAMAGGIAEIYYKDIPKEIKERIFEIIPGEFSKIISEFSQKFIQK